MTTVFGTEVDPSFNAAGNKIVYSTSRDGNFEIYVMDTNGENTIRLTKNDSNDAQPDFNGGI